MTVIAWVVAPFDQRFPVADEDVNTTLPPVQKVVAPPAVTVGVAGNGFTVTVVPAEVAEVQFPLFTETLYVPDAVTVIAFVPSGPRSCQICAVYVPAGTPVIDQRPSADAWAYHGLATTTTNPAMRE